MQRPLAAALAAILLLASCATGAQARAPEWALSTPRPDASFTYFVGYASAPNGDEAAAANDAAANLVAEIMKYIGVEVSVDSTASARATLDSYAAEVRSTVTAQSSGRLVGFVIKDKYVSRDRRTGQAIVYVLAAYQTLELEREKRRIAEAFQEKIDAVAKPEAEGRALAEAGRYYDAVRKFAEAAVAASGSGIDNAEIKLERNLNSARSALARLRFERLGEGYSAYVGQPFPAPFRLRLVSGEGASAPGVPGAALLVSYQRRQGARTVARTESASTDASGLLSFTPPPPDFVGRARLAVRVDFQSVVDLLDALPPRWAAQREGLQDELRSKALEIDYQVISRAREAPTAIAIVDLDEAGQVLSAATAQAGLSEALAKEGFSLQPLALEPELLVSGLEEAVIARARALLGARAERLAFGSARLLSVRREGSTYLAQAQARVKVVELATGALLYAGERQATGLGADEASARRAALRELGLNALGKDLLSSLP